MSYVDFQELKEKMSIRDAVELLGLDMQERGEQLRCKCPSCETDDPRSLVVTPTKGVYYCFADGKGGDLIALAAHVKQIAPKDAAQFLNGSEEKPVNTSEEKKEGERGFKPLTYLESDHPAVDAVGFDENIAAAVGIGFAKRGILKGNVCVPVRLPNGQLIGYMGVTEALLPSTWHL